MQCLRLWQIEEKLGLKKTKIYSMIANGLLPKPQKFGRASFWVESEVEDSIKKLIKNNATKQVSND